MMTLVRRIFRLSVFALVCSQTMTASGANINVAIIFIGLLMFSRIATVLSFIGYAIGVGLIYWVFNFPSEHLYLSIGFNFILTAIAMGGIWFVPHVTSFLFAGGAVLLCAVILAGTANLFYFFGLPVLILPFNLTVLVLLYGMRQRIVDRHPKSIDFLFGTPEANAAYYHTRLTRFGANFANQISLPFLGTWTCTQSTLGGVTHQSAWEHAFDFEVQDPSKRFYKNEGKEVSDYFCYNLPVLACCDGQVVNTVDHLPDNLVGKLELKENWGNLVVIQHGPHLFSMVCHLAENSLKVKKGDLVKKGDILGSCGNSGRSAHPHLHFQLQNSARVGAPTIYSEFHEVILEGKSPFLHSTYVPRQGDTVRNVRRQEEIADHFNHSIGQKISLACHVGNKHWEEVVESTVDLYGNFMVRAIRDYLERTSHAVGFKPAGGIRTAKQALDWLILMKEELGDEWLSPERLRLGASTLLGDIERQLEHHVTGFYSAGFRHPMG